jgi:hypothetical protein
VLAQEIARIRGLAAQFAATVEELDLRVLLRKLEEAYSEALLQAHMAYEQSKKGESY